MCGGGWSLRIRPHVDPCCHHWSHVCACASPVQLPRRCVPPKSLWSLFPFPESPLYPWLPSPGWRRSARRTRCLNIVCLCYALLTSVCVCVCARTRACMRVCVRVCVLNYRVENTPHSFGLLLAGEMENRRPQEREYFLDSRADFSVSLSPSVAFL